MKDILFRKALPLTAGYSILLGLFTLAIVGPLTPVQIQWNLIGGGNHWPAIFGTLLLPFILLGTHAYLSRRAHLWEEDAIGRTLGGYAILIVVILAAQSLICLNALNTKWTVWV